MTSCSLVFSRKNSSNLKWHLCKFSCQRWVCIRPHTSTGMSRWCWYMSAYSWRFPQHIHRSLHTVREHRLSQFTLIIWRHTELHRSLTVTSFAILIQPVSWWAFTFVRSRQLDTYVITSSLILAVTLGIVCNTTGENDSISASQTVSQMISISVYQWPTHQHRCGCLFRGRTLVGSCNCRNRSPHYKCGNNLLWRCRTQEYLWKMANISTT